MRKYKFTQQKDKCTWSNGEIKLQFSDPSIQPHDEYSYLKDEKGIMYYYYTVKIFKNVWVGYDDKASKSIYGWKLVAKRSTHDFPTIEQFKPILKHALHELNPTIDGEKHEYMSGDIEYSKTLHTEGFACDDFYEITKFVNENNEIVNYILYFGCTFSSQGDLNSEGIRTPYVTEDDVKELLKCVEGFIQYSIDKHNNEVREYIKEQTSNKVIKNGKIYEYEKGELESIYIVGDSGDFTILKDKETSPNSIDYHRVSITGITNNTVILSNAKEVNIHDVMYISNNVSNEKLKYGFYEIIRDFASILNNEEIEEFKTSDADNLFNKYKNAIMDRTWMCRDEHGLGGNPDEFKTVHRVIRKVIDEIKRIL